MKDYRSLETSSCSSHVMRRASACTADNLLSINWTRLSGSAASNCKALVGDLRGISFSLIRLAQSATTSKLRDTTGLASASSTRNNARPRRSSAGNGVPTLPVVGIILVLCSLVCKSHRLNDHNIRLQYTATVNEASAFVQHAL